MAARLTYVKFIDVSGYIDPGRNIMPLPQAQAAFEEEMYFQGDYAPFECFNLIDLPLSFRVSDVL